MRGPDRGLAAAGGGAAGPRCHRGERLPRRAHGGGAGARRGCRGDRMRRRVRGVSLHVDRSRRDAARASHGARPRLHPLHVGHDCREPRRRAVAPRDPRAGGGGRRRPRASPRRPHPLGAAARVSLRGDDRRLRARGGAHAPVLGFSPGGAGCRGRYASRHDPVRIADALRAPRRLAGGDAAHLRADRPVDGHRVARRDRASLHRPVRHPARPGVRPHRGRSTVHQHRSHGGAADVRRARRARIPGGGPRRRRRRGARGNGGRGGRARRGPVRRVLQPVAPARRRDARRMADDGRRRRLRCGRSAAPARADESAHLGRGHEGLPRGGRGTARLSPCRSRVARVRPPPCAPRRGAVRRGGGARRPSRHVRCRRPDRLLRARAVGLEGAGEDHRRARHPAHARRQDSAPAGRSASTRTRWEHTRGPAVPHAVDR